jgi:hypothetical protein
MPVLEVLGSNIFRIFGYPFKYVASEYRDG